MGTITEAKRRLAPREPPEAWSRPTGAISLAIEDASGGGDGCIRIHKTRFDQEGDMGISQTTDFIDNMSRVEYTQFKCPWGDDLPTEPIVIIGCCNDWPAFGDADKNWTIPNLTIASASRSREEHLFSVDGGPGFARESYGEGRVSMAEYARYCLAQADGDAAPLYIFDHRCLGVNGGEARLEANGLNLRRDFDVPRSFQRDVMCGLTGSRFRPLPPSWLLVACARSGTPIHDHPLTIAWNALLSGCKLWAILPPDVEESFLLLNSDTNESGRDSRDGTDFDLSALDWFGRCQPNENEGSLRVCIQRPGEVVFVPSGWWHVVLNVSDSVQYLYFVCPRSLHLLFLLLLLLF